MNLIVAISQAWYYGYGRYANQIPGIASQNGPVFLNNSCHLNYFSIVPSHSIRTL